MALLKKIKASTLMETLVATALIVIVFMLASMVLNNLFANSIRFNDNSVQQELIKLQYQNQNGLLELPYYEEWGNWELEVNTENWQSTKKTVFMATHASSGKEIVFKK